MIKEVLSIFNLRLSRATPSLLGALSKIVPIDILENVIGNLKDWREILENLAISLNTTQDAIMAEVSRELGIEIIENVPPCNPNLLPKRLTLDDFERIATVPLMKGDKIEALICVDPKRLTVLGLNLKKIDIYLAPWHKISSSLEESRTIYQQSHSSHEIKNILASEANTKIAARIIDRITAEVINYGGLAVSLTFRSDLIEYNFELSDGRKGKGSINGKLTPVLLRYLRNLQVNPESLNISPTGDSVIKPQISFMGGPLTTITICWDDRATKRVIG